ncbi:MAG: nucleotidyltransferase domain-containing protein [Candidatus Bathyarchaeota archaeon]|nr:nucleotidyltransferase domain-containing protein [Candidatus Bathyarchaeota archaeon]
MEENWGLKQKVAKEAAALLYSGAEKEYKQAKVKAAKILGSHFLPSNLEVAKELDKLAEALEGPARKERLISMRGEALRIMKFLADYTPRLVGSVWRGTIRRESDIDIAVYHDKPEEILRVLRKNGVKIIRTEWITATKKGKPVESFHIYVETSAKHRVEIVVRKTEDANCRRKCEIFGDELKGLNIQELEGLLKENPTKKFIPV